MQILEGYGLTETTAPATVYRAGELRISTLGRALPGVEIRIADDGEILIRGVNVFDRYSNDEPATATAFHDGWFATGDLGDLDADGVLTVTGRAKELIVTASGKTLHQHRSKMRSEGIRSSNRSSSSAKVSRSSLH